MNKIIDPLVMENIEVITKHLGVKKYFDSRSSQNFRQKTFCN